MMIIYLEISVNTQISTDIIMENYWKKAYFLLYYQRMFAIKTGKNTANLVNSGTSYSTESW